MNWNVNVLLDDLRHDVRHFHQFSPKLRHCDIENKLDAAATVPLVPRLRPHLNQCCWPRSWWRRLLAPPRAVQLALLHLSGSGVFWPRKASFVAPSTTLVSHVEGLVPEEWWSASARAQAIDIRSCRHHERSRRSRRRLAAPVARSAIGRPLGSIVQAPQRNPGHASDRQLGGGGGGTDDVF